jgi:hypothetical protein
MQWRVVAVKSLLEVVVLADRDEDVQKSEQARTGTLPKNLIARLSRAKLALGMAESSNTEGEERGLLSGQEYLSVRVCICARGEEEGMNVISYQ